MRVYLLRHGKTVPDPQYDEVLRQPNPGLDTVGLRQAELLGRRLQGRGIEAVYSSDLKRTAETARIVAGYVHTPAVKAGKTCGGGPGPCSMRPSCGTAATQRS